MKKYFFEKMKNYVFSCEKFLQQFIAKFDVIIRPYCKRDATFLKKEPPDPPCKKRSL